MPQKLIRASELAEFVYCSKAWHLKYVAGAEVSPAAREERAKGVEWHDRQGRTLGRGDALRRAAFAAFTLAVILFTFCWWDGRGDRAGHGRNGSYYGPPAVSG